MPNACLPISIGYIRDFAPRRINARKVCRCGNVGFAGDARHGFVRAFTRSSACAVSNRHKARAERGERYHRLPQLLFHLVGFWREEFKADFAIAGKPSEKWRGDSAAGLLHLCKWENHATILKLFADFKLGLERGWAPESFWPIQTFITNAPASSAVW